MHRPHLAAALIVLAAPALALAQRGAPPAATPPATTPPASAVASDEPALVAGPNPSDPQTITARVSGLPALSADGHTLVVESVDEQPASEGGLTLLLLDAATGRVRQRVVVQTNAQHIDLNDTTPPAPARYNALQARVAAARAAMTALHLHTLREGGEAQPSYADDDAWVVSAGALRVRAEGARLVVRRVNNGAGREVLRRPLPRAHEARECRGANPPALRAAYALGTDRVLVLAGWHGNDTCWESNPVWRVYRLRATP